MRTYRDNSTKMKDLISKIKTKWRIKRIVGLGFAFALLISCTSSLIAYWSTLQVFKITDDVSYSHKVIQNLREVTREFSDAESNHQTYMITRDETYLSAYHKAPNNIRKKIIELRKLTSNNPDYKIKLDTLDRIINKRFLTLEKSINLKNEANNAALEIILIKEGKGIMDIVQRTINEIGSKEKALVQNNGINEATNKLSKKIITIIIMGNVVTFLILASSGFVIFNEITTRNYFENELIKAKEIAEHSVKAKEKFLANMSHEIRTPINAVLGLTRVLLKSNPSVKQKEYLDAIKTSGDILIVLINEILDLAKIEAGKIVFEKNGFKLSDLITSTIDMLQSKADEKDLKLIHQFDEKIPEVLIGDTVRLNQIILNLLGNSIKFTETGEIKLMAELVDEDEENAVVKFSVTDTGIGIPTEKLSTIFESFTQASAETTRRYGGTGLGLAIVKQLVELQEGEVAVESKVGKGSSFKFILKFKKGKDQNVINDDWEKIQIINPDLGKIKILLVEDNTINQLVAKTVLTDFGFETDIADNGKIAIEKIQKENYNIILMDVQMPEMDGYETTQYIREKMLPPKSEIPILAMTAYANIADAKKCIKVGMTDYISKPFDENNLYSKIAMLVNKSEVSPIDESIEIPVIKDGRCTSLNYLKKFSKGNEKFMIEIISLFLKQAPLAIKNMQTHLENKEWKSLMGEAHKIKPSFRFMGITELDNVDRLIEEYADTKKHLDVLPKLILQMETICNKAFIELEEELKELTKEHVLS